MKNIIIAGPSRAGKTTLARKISEELGYFVISLDKLVATFNGAYPQLNIRLAWNREKTTENIAPFLGHFLGMISCDHGAAYELNLNAHAIPGNKFVLEGGYFDFDKIAPILKTYGIKDFNDKFILIGLTQNNKSADEFTNDFIKHDTPDDWTYGFDDGDLREISEDAISFGRYMTGHLIKHGFTIYDTSINRRKVMNKILEEIKEKLQ